MRKNMLKQLAVLAGAVALSGCLGSAPQSGSGGSGSGSGDTGGNNSGGSTSGGSGDNGGTSGGSTSGGTSGSAGGSGTTAGTDPNLAARTIDYGQALRTAAVKLVGGLPTLDEQAAVTDATSYAAQLDKYMADPRFAVQLKAYYSNMMKMGGTLPVVNGTKTVNVSLDTAPTYAAELVVKDLPITNLFTGTTNTCPTLNTTTGAFTDAACAASNGVVTSGVLTDPGAMAQFYSNMAFRRVRWVQETFVCNAMPTEFSATPQAMGSGQYTSPWPFTSITGGTSALINFQDTSSIICANCHTTLNHIAPLFSQFDVAGAYQTSIQVHTPTPAAPITVMGDWLPSTESLAWRFGTKVTTMTDLGNAMAADQNVLKCQVQRAWNWAMSKSDIVNSLATVPDTTIADQWSLFQSNGYKMKAVLKSIFTADDFVKF